jgi:hypothetical protein
VVVADLVVASFHQTHTHHSFNIVIEPFYHSLIGASQLVVLVVLQTNLVWIRQST